MVGHARWIAEWLRPMVRQYYMESDTDGVPINRMYRSVVYQRSTGAMDSVPFGTRVDIYRVGYEWMGHSLAAHKMETLDTDPRVLVGGCVCSQPYSASIFNISAMSFGALSQTAVLALNHGARIGGFAHNTGEGGLSSYHLKPGGDLIWQVGTGYFGCRTQQGGFCAQQFAEKVVHSQLIFVDEGIGRVYTKALYRRYANKGSKCDWDTIIDGGAGVGEVDTRIGTDREHLGMLGPIIRAEVNDTIFVHFRNNTSFPTTVHPHGVFYDKDSEGSPYADGTSGANKADDSVSPGDQHTYT